MPYEIRPKCKCGKELPSVTAGEHATFIANRKCQRCGSRWHVIVRPNFLPPGISAKANQVEMTCL